LGEKKKIFPCAADKQSIHPLNNQKGF